MKNNKLDDGVLEYGRTIYSIERLKNVGGIMKSEDTLSLEGSYWIFPDTEVYCNARIFDNDIIYDWSFDY